MIEVLGAEPSLTAENIGAISALITAIVAGITALIVARSKAHTDDYSALRNKLAEAEIERDKAVADRRADAEIFEARYQQAQQRVIDREHQITAIDRMLITAYAYIAQLSRSLIDHGLPVPPRPAELDKHNSPSAPPAAE